MGACSCSLAGADTENEVNFSQNGLSDVQSYGTDEELRPKTPSSVRAGGGDGKVGDGEVAAVEEEGATTAFVPSSASAACPICEKFFNPRGGNAFDSITKHLRSCEDEVHKAVAASLAGKPRCIVCSGSFPTASAVVEHIVTTECRKDFGEVAIRAALVAKQKPNNKQQPKAKGKAKGGQREEARALYSAAKGNDLEGVKRILVGGDNASSSASSLTISSQGHQAAQLCNTSFDDGYTPLMTAAEAGHSEVVSILLLNSADPALKNSYGQSAVILATINGRDAAVRALVEPVWAREATIRSEHQGAIALTWAARQGREAIVSTLLDAKANVNHGGDKTPLVEAILGGFASTVRLLARHTDARWTNSQGKTALYLAVTLPSGASAEVVEALISEQGANLKQKFPPPEESPGSTKQVTLAMIAKSGGRDDLVKLLTPTDKASCTGCTVS